MVSFVCDDCQTTVKKPKVQAHLSRCRTYSISCIDCGTSFTASSYTTHTSCVTEKDKYQGKFLKKQAAKFTTPKKDVVEVVPTKPNTMEKITDLVLKKQFAKSKKLSIRKLVNKVKLKCKKLDISEDKVSLYILSQLMSHDATLNLTSKASTE